MKKRDIIYVLVILLLMVWVAHYITGDNRVGNGNPFSKVDSVVFVDTVPFHKPIPKDSVVLRYHIVKVPIASKDSVSHDDTVSVQIPITQKEYSDSSYHAWVSGYIPQLDSIKIYNKNTVITQTAETIKYKTRHWGAGIQVGCGYGNNISPYIGIGVQYNIFSW